MKTFERQILRTRNRIEVRGQKMAFSAIKSQYKAVYDLIGLYSIEQLKEAVNKVVTKEPIIDFFGSYYSMFAPIGVMYRNNVLKSAEDEFYTNVFSERLRKLGLVEVGKKITSITATTEKFIRGAVESAMTEGFEEGLGIEKIEKLIRKYLTSSLGDIGRSRAKMIAQTEMITASNQASQEGIESTGMDYIKFWSTSGLKGVRESHDYAERNHPNGIAKDEYFDMGNGNKMLFVGDPNGVAEEVINCRCTTLYEII